MDTHGTYLQNWMIRIQTLPSLLNFWCQNQTSIFTIKVLLPSPRCHKTHMKFFLSGYITGASKEHKRIRKLQSIQGLPNGFVQILLPTKDILSRKSQTLTQICTLKLGTMEQPPGNPFSQTQEAVCWKTPVGSAIQWAADSWHPGVYDSR